MCSSQTVAGRGPGPWGRTFDKAGVALSGQWCLQLRQTGKYYMLPMGDTE